MTSSLPQRLLLWMALLATPLSATAWGADGHETVGTIAAGLIKGTPTEARVKALLGGIDLPLATVWGDCAKGIDPAQNYSYTVTGRFPDCAPLETPEHIAEMADYVRRNDLQCGTAAGRENCHKQSHYVNLPYQRSRYVLGFTGTREFDIVGTLSAAIQVLQGKPSPARYSFKDRREALLVLAHLIGDVHQPLHVGSLFLDLDGRRVDPDKTDPNPAFFTVGGNAILKAMPAPPNPPVGIAEFAAGFRPPNLHAIWDDVPGALTSKHVDAVWLKAARAVPGSPGEPKDWPARYAGGSLEQAGSAFVGLEFAPKANGVWRYTAPAGYEARMLLIKKRQLTLAGARFAQILKAALP